MRADRNVRKPRGFPDPRLSRETIPGFSVLAIVGRRTENVAAPRRIAEVAW